MDLCFLVPGVPSDSDIAAQHARRLAGRHAVTVASCADTTAARQGRYDAVVAFDWTATVPLFAFDSARYVYHVDGFAHDRMGSDPQRFAAQLSYDLPVDFIAAAPWVARALAQHRPDARCLTVPPGVTREPAAPEAVIVLDGDPLPEVLAGRVVIASSALPGVGDVIEHGVNGFVVEPDDDRGPERFRALLADDREQLERMAAAARATAWPDPDEAAVAFEQALETIVAEPMPDAARWPDRLMADAMAAVAALAAPQTAAAALPAAKPGDRVRDAATRLRSAVRRGS